MKREQFRIEYIYKGVVGVVIPDINPNKIYHMKTEDFYFEIRGGLKFYATIDNGKISNIENPFYN